MSETIEQRLDEILQNYYDNTDDFVVGGMGFQEDNEDTAKQALLQLINEARIDELKQLWIGVEYIHADSITNRLAQLGETK